MNTRAKNSTQRPGLVVEKKKRCSKEEVQAERQAKEDAKEEKACTKAAGIKRVAAYEQNQANKDVVEATPKAAPQPRALHRTCSYAHIPEREDTVPDSDFETREPDTEESIYNVVADNNDDERTESAFASPPRKKAKVVAKVVSKVTKAPKPKVRVAVKAAQDEALEKGKGKA